MSFFNRYPPGWAVLLLFSSLGCDVAQLSNTTGAVHPVTQDAIHAAAAADRTNDPLLLQKWGKDPYATVGDLVVLTGKLGDEPFRLWFVTRSPLPDEGTLELDEDDAAQLVVGQPYSFVSNRVELELSVWDHGTVGHVAGRARRPELTQHAGPLRFEGSVAIRKIAPTATSTPREVVQANLPVSNYTSYVLPEAPRRYDSAPAGYELRKRPNFPLVIAGAATFLGSYALSVAGAALSGFDGNSEVYLVPVAGPTMFLVQNIQEGKAPGLGLLGWIVVGYATVGSTLVQAGGLGLFSAGFLFPRREWTLKDHTDRKAQVTARLQLRPLLGPQVQGLELYSEF